MKRELKIAGLSPSDAYYFNAVSCFPPDTPTKSEVLACKPNLKAQWDAIPADYVLVCGRVALEALMPHATRHTRNKPIEIHGKIIFPVHHPAYVLRDGMAFQPWQKALREFKLLVSGWAELIELNTACPYCRKPRVGLWTCGNTQHRTFWNKDKRWQLPKPQQLGLGI